METYTITIEVSFEVPVTGEDHAWDVAQTAVEHLNRTQREGWDNTEFHITEVALLEED